MLQVLEDNCSSSALAFILSAAYKTLKIIQIVGPILLMIMAVIRITQMMMHPDDKKGLKKIFNSFLAAALLFFIPLFVDVLLGSLGETNSISACWKSMKEPEVATQYVDPYGNDPKHSFITNPDEYQKGTPKPSPSSSGGSIGTGTGGDNPSLVDDSKYSQYQTIATCDSSTLKFRIMKVNNAEIAVVWVQNASMQMNGALANPTSFGRASAETILGNEINANGYQNKCLIAINSSFFSYSTGSPVGGVVINKGIIVKDKGNASGCIGVDSSSKLVECSHKPASEIASQGIRNTFVISSPAGHDDSGATANRTQICQIDTNNFVLYSGSGTVGGCANVTQRVTGCDYSYNLDGGGSRKLYYKTQSSSSVTRVFGGGRELPDMLYFVEA